MNSKIGFAFIAIPYSVGRTIKGSYKFHKLILTCFLSNPFPPEGGTGSKNKNLIPEVANGMTAPVGGYHNRYHE